MKALILASFMILTSAFTAVGQAAERVSSDGEGYSFLPVKGWQHTASGEGYTLANPQKTIVIAVKAHNYRDFAAFMADANLTRDGLEPVGKSQAIKGGTTFRTIKRTAQGNAVIDTAVVFSKTGGGVVVVAISDEAHAVAAFNAGIEIAGSILFFTPKETETAGRVRSLLSGKQLLYLFTGNGYSERKDILLCASGVFYQSTNLNGFTTNDVSGPSFAAIGGKRGAWSVGPAGTKLILKFEAGGTTEFTLSARQARNEIGMNGQRFFVQDQNLCR